MNAKQIVPVLAKLAPVLAAAGPPVLIGVAIGGALLWLFSDGNKPAATEAPKPAPDIPRPAPVTTPAPVLAVPLNPPPQAKRVRREDVAEALAYGARSMTRGEAVAALQKLGFGKTAAYKAMSSSGRFAGFIAESADGLITWNG